MSYEQLEKAYTESQKKIFELRAENDELRHGRHWCDVVGSSWELQRRAPAAKPTAAEMMDKSECSAGNLDNSQLNATLRNYEANERLIMLGFRQIKYELYCATVDLLGYSLHVIPGRNCLVTSIYGLKTGLPEFEFLYDARQHRYVDLLWSDTVAKYAQAYQYWIQENHCIQGFMASVFLEEYGQRGLPPARERTTNPTNNN